MTSTALFHPSPCPCSLVEVLHTVVYQGTVPSRMVLCPCPSSLPAALCKPVCLGTVPNCMASPHLDLGAPYTLTPTRLATLLNRETKARLA